MKSLFVLMLVALICPAGGQDAIGALLAALLSDSGDSADKAAEGAAAAAARGKAPEPLEPLLAELLRTQKLDRPPKLTDFGHELPQQEDLACPGRPEELKMKFEEMIPAEQKNHPDVIAIKETVFSRIDYCKSQLNDDVYQSLRTAILAGLFDGKVGSLKVDKPMQADCLKHMVFEQEFCGELNKELCEFTNPINAFSRDFGVRDVRELVFRFSDLDTTGNPCVVMAAALTEIETLINIKHPSKNVVDKGIATGFIDALDQASEGGVLKGLDFGDLLVSESTLDRNRRLRAQHRRFRAAARRARIVQTQ